MLLVFNIVYFSIKSDVYANLKASVFV